VKVLEQRLPFDDFRFDQVRPDGTIAHVSVSGKPVFDENGMFRGYRGAGRDISKIVKAEAELRVARDRAEAANHAKSEFLAQMSHDFRTPLNAILGFSQMISEGALGPVGNSRYQEYARDIFRSGQVLLDFVNNLLDISKIEAGELTIQKISINIESIVAEVEHLMKPRFKEKELAFNVVVASEARTVEADRLALWHMLINLFSNAIKFTPEKGNVTLRAARQNGEVTISVEDTGIGFDPTEHKALLTPFGRGRNARDSNIEGTGLGLAIVKAMVEAHHGRFELKSGVGRGTTASLVFPAIGDAAGRGAPSVTGGTVH
jgi:two-component system cell cycle sensor histidine kinase PleC